ncbi:MAG: deoxyribodipyrimidine photo-lyase [Bacteroidetes bacterium]|nr:MAG: deoxyribodipyrimidine photo-lyase [Bacteroidota bacterium]
MQITIFWHRRDLRLDDNAGLYQALKSGFPVLPIFIFDKNILDKLDDPSDRRVNFIYQELENIKNELEKIGSSLLIFYGNPLEIWQELIKKHEIKAVYTNTDYEPYAINRDLEVQKLLDSQKIAFHSFKDQCILDHKEVLKDDGTPYSIFTPYSKKWKSVLTDFHLKSYKNEKYFANFLKTAPFESVSLEKMGFQNKKDVFPEKIVSDQIIAQYADKRNFPAIKGTSRLSVHLRFGTISVRTLARQGLGKEGTWLNELIWRDFYMMILAKFPKVVDQSFKKQYDRIQWRNNPEEFEAWCEGKTGYPIVDAGMRELNATGFMHNRVRMIVASFLTKHLLVDWRWGELYFAKKLLDFDLSANNGGWQWAASCGCDATPYFRIFSPLAQTAKFDKDLIYIKKWIPELQTFAYPKPIVKHEFARERALETYKKALGE